VEHFVNRGRDLVVEALDGVLVAAGAGHLARLEGLPDIKVVVRADMPEDEVAVISGGGSGHEPAHAGFVGPGLLSAAVCGDIFASPSVEAVLAAIRAVTGPAGCLLVVKNYTGDRLTFGLAAERAKLEGFDVAMVVVADDVAIPEAPQPRGLAGTLFVHKVAAALASAGQPLATVAAAGREAAASVRTLGVAVTGAAIPGRPAEVRLAAGEAELGLGIHGEPGVEVVRLADVRTLVALMAQRLEAAVARGPVALLANNLGGATGLEMAVILREFLDSPLGRRAEFVVGPAALMTSMAMKGFSLSVLPLDDERRAALRAPCAPWTAWPGARPLGPPDTRPLAQPMATAVATPSAHPPTRAALATIGQCLVAAEADLNALDAKVGDGDTGSTLATAGRRVLEALDTLPMAEPAKLCGELATLMATSVGGSSGVLLAVFCTAAASACSAGASWTAALQRGAEAIQTYGGAGEGDRTMLDALLPALRALSAENQGAEGLRAAADAAREGADATAAMARARAGRASYVGAAHLQGVVDPGAEAVARVFAALAAGAS
jgi:dihydroxyacetone kinase